MVTTRADVALAVHGADCAIVALWSPEGVIGAAHAGWRGLEAGVIPASAARMRDLGATSLSAVAGPCIGPECYEFGADEPGPPRAAARTRGAGCRRAGAPRPSICPAALAPPLAAAGVDLVGAALGLHGVRRRVALVAPGPGRARPPGPGGVAWPRARRDRGRPGARWPCASSAVRARIHDAGGGRDGRDRGGHQGLRTRRGPGRPRPRPAPRWARTTPRSCWPRPSSSPPTRCRVPCRSWHFLGRLQRNKVRHLAPVVAVWESVDRPELVDEIARRAPGAVVFVQANLSGEAQKGGAPLDRGPRPGRPGPRRRSDGRRA